MSFIADYNKVRLQISRMSFITDYNKVRLQISPMSFIADYKSIIIIKLGCKSAQSDKIVNQPNEFYRRL